MTDKELRRMGRGDLLEMLLKERTENESLSTRLNASSTELLEVKNRLGAMEDEVKRAQESEEQMKAAKEASEQELDSVKQHLTVAEQELAEVSRELEETRQSWEKSQQEVKAARTLLQESEQKLAARKIEMDEAGSIAEASLRLNGIFEAAQRSADEYLNNIKDLKERQEAVCAKRASESREEAERRLTVTMTQCNDLASRTRAKCAALQEKTQTECAALQEKTQKECETKTRETDESCAAKLAETEAKCASAVTAAKDEADRYWKSLSGRMEDFYNAHAGMKDILAFYDMKMPTFDSKKEDSHE